MAGEEDLSKLIKSMSPSLDGGTYVFCHIPADSASGQQLAVDFLTGKVAQMIFWESEGWTVILPESTAKGRSLQPVFTCKKITLNVHSSLDAVGFLAAITTRLAKLSIGVNPVSGYYHDHLFVPVGKEDAVMGALKSMVEEANKP
jgi:hypothetical protein